MSFYEEIKDFRWAEVRDEIRNCTETDVERSLASRHPSSYELMSLLSPAGEPYLEEIAQRANRVTQQRFGRVISMFAPLYLSNFCTNSCVYCGFNTHNPVERSALTVEQAMAEGNHVHQLGFRHLLLVSGEAPNMVTTEYLGDVAGSLRSLFASISIEVYPMATDDYRKLIARGVDGLVVFQETYNESRYSEFHPAGRKRDYRWRIETPDRGGDAGFRRLGIGALLGLDDWRVEGFFLGLHARYLLRHYWRSRVTISFPRLRPAAGEYQPPSPVSDLNLVQLLTALRVCLPDADLVLSTRESAHLRDHLIPLGVTSMSAGSRTDPGGYTHVAEAEPQFRISDERSPRDVAEVIKRKGYEPVWKDWDEAFLS